MARRLRKSWARHPTRTPLRTAMSFARERTRSRAQPYRARDAMLFSPRHRKSKNGYRGMPANDEQRSAQPARDLADEPAADHRVHHHRLPECARRVRPVGDQLRHARHHEGIPHSAQCGPGPGAVDGSPGAWPWGRSCWVASPTTSAGAAPSSHFSSSWPSACTSARRCTVARSSRPGASSRDWGSAACWRRSMRPRRNSRTIACASSGLR